MFLDFKNKNKTIVLRNVPAMAKKKFKMETAILVFTNEEQKTTRDAQKQFFSSAKRHNRGVKTLTWTIHNLRIRSSLSYLCECNAIRYTATPKLNFGIFILRRTQNIVKQTIFIGYSTWSHNIQFSFSSSNIKVQLLQRSQSQSTVLCML